ncbi:exodeoxyribonuclease VII small subunit [Candidatus Symbiobacter mobilis]|uniref:Uncharacterized protein n=1 Tax=Candidatus Symbiobacter mobilis CR TaxID=946483 RepID=U5N9T4_9BURK|nr:exodeoxyribonuclease VII small subunit [Candidatus Symbiobacter mobilis]AGX86934.1 hypothetical protein Cenrod_0829 [Candidatus Symbiobacter mobilis CR]
MNATFKAAYKTLKTNADTLRKQHEPNIDDLLQIVTESVAAYKICQERINAVEKALEKALHDADTPTSEAPKGEQVAQHSSPPKQDEKIDDDIDEDDIDEETDYSYDKDVPF